MPNLYLTEQGAQLRRQGESLVLTQEGKTLATVRSADIDTVLVFGRVHLTLPAMELLLDKGIETAFLTMGGKLKGQLTPAANKNNVLRYRQFEAATDPPRRLAFARTIVVTKLRGQAEVLKAFRYNHPQVDLSLGVQGLEDAERSAKTADSVESLLGIEGGGARAYWDVFGRMLLSGFSFTGRSRRPARDPVNALLNFSYTLVCNELISLLDAAGFDPYVGFFHALDYGRPSLALDLLEEFRAPICDRLVLTLLNRRVLGPEDFHEETPEEGVRLARDGARTFFTHYERWMRADLVPDDTVQTSFRTVFRDQIASLARAVKGGAAYEPYVWR